MTLAALPPPLPPPLPPSLPRRDLESRASLDDAARTTRPLALARDRLLPVAGALGALLPGGGLQRGSVIAVEGALGSGATSITLELAAAATRAGEWAAVVDPDGTLGGLAAGEVGVAWERFAMVRRVPPARWAVVVAALLDGLSVVVAGVPRSVRVGDARRLVARARERGAVLVATGLWPADAALRLCAEGVVWQVNAAGLDRGPRRVRVEHHGIAGIARAV